MAGTLSIASYAGVFMRMDRGIGEAIWHLSAFQSVAELIHKELITLVPHPKAESL